MIYTHSSYVTMTYTVATTIMPLRPYITATTMSIYSSYVTMVHTVSTTITQALYYSNYYASMIYIYSSYVAIIYRTLLHSPINTNLCILFRPITTIMQQAMTTACPLLEDPADARTRSG